MGKRRILQSKFYLYLTEFFSGMAVMAVELGASRLLAPYFSSSQIVWTIIIGTIMIAMALGNLWGGRKADRDPDPDKLYGRILIAAIWLSAIPVVGKYLIVLISGVLVLTISTNLLIIAAFASCMIIFVFPLFLLGTVTPSLIKYTVDSLDNSGSVVGRLGAANTIGSIIGTFLPTFVTIPAVGTSATFLIFAGVLLVLALVYFIHARVCLRRSIAAVLIFALCCGFGYHSHFAFWQNDLTYEGESVYNYLQVYDTNEKTVLSTNVLFGEQSVMMKDNGLTGMYYDYALAGPVMADLMQKKNPHILILGNGTGTYAKQCKKYFPDASIEGAEIDDKITELAGKYFAMPESVDVTTYDGRAYLQSSRQKYDMILVDAYQDITIPFQMSSEEFFTMVKNALNEDGVMVVNMNMHSDGKGSINEALTDTICSVFSSVYTADVKDYTNRELFAGKNDVAKALESHETSVTDLQLRKMMQTVADSLVKQEGGTIILTDDKAPVEVLGMRMIDSLVKDEAGYYKEIFKKQGIQGLMPKL